MIKNLGSEERNLPYPLLLREKGVKVRVREIIRYFTDTLSSTEEGKGEVGLTKTKMKLEY